MIRMLSDFNVMEDNRAVVLHVEHMPPEALDR